MKKRVTRRILAGFLAFLMLFSTVTWDELAFTSAAAEPTEYAEESESSGGKDISGGNEEPAKDVSGGGADIQESISAEDVSGGEDVSAGDDQEETKLYKVIPFHSAEAMESYVSGDTDEKYLAMDTAEEADSIEEALTALEQEDTNTGYVLVRQQLDGYGFSQTPVTVPESVQALVVETLKQIPHYWDEETQEDYTIYRARENAEQQENILFATKDGEVFYAFNWDDFVDMSEEYNKETLESKYAECFEPDANNPEMWTVNYSFSGDGQSLYFVGDYVSFPSEGESVTISGTGTQVIFTAGSVDVRQDLVLDGSAELHLLSEDFTINSDMKNVSRVVMEKWGDRTQQSLDLQFSAGMTLPPIEVNDGMEARIMIRFYDSEGNEKAAKQIASDEWPQITSAVTSDGQTIALWYDGLYFDEADGERRYNPVGGEKVLNFGTTGLEDKFLYDGYQRIDADGCIDASNSLYRGVVLSKEEYTAACDGSYESTNADNVYADSLKELFEKMQTGLPAEEGADKYALISVQNWISADNFENIDIPAGFTGVIFTGDGSQETCWIAEKEYPVYTIFYTENHTDEEEVLVRRFAVVGDGQYREIADSEEGTVFVGEVLTQEAFDEIKNELQEREGSGIGFNHYFYKTTQITMHNNTEVRFRTHVSTVENEEWDTADELLIKGADGSLSGARLVFENTTLSGRISCSDEDVAGLTVEVFDRLNAYSIKAGNLIVRAKEDEIAHVDYMEPLYIQNDISIYGETYFTMQKEIHGILFHAAKLNLKAELHVDYADNGEVVRGETLLVEGLTGSTGNTVDNFYVFDRAHDRNYTILDNGVAGWGMYSAIVFDTEEKLDTYMEEWNDDTITAQFDRESLQGALDAVGEYGKDAYVMIATWEEVAGADSVTVPANVKTIVLDACGEEVPSDENEDEVVWVPRDFRLNEIRFAGDGTVLQISSQLVSKDDIFRIVFEQEDGEVIFGSNQTELQKIVCGTADGKEAGLLTVKDDEITLPYMEGFRELELEQCVLTLTGEEQYRFPKISIGDGAELVLPAYNPERVPLFETIEPMTSGSPLTVSFTDTSAMKRGSRIVRFNTEDPEELEELSHRIYVELPFGMLDSYGFLRTILVYGEDWLEFLFTYSDSVQSVRTTDISLVVAMEDGNEITDKSFALSDSREVCRNVVDSLKVDIGERKDVNLKVGITKGFGPKKLYLWYTSEKESYVIGEFDVYKSLEEVEIVKILGWEPVTYEHGLPGVISPYSYVIFPDTVKALLSDGTTVELSTYLKDDGGFRIDPAETTTYYMRGTVSERYGCKFPEGVSNEIVYEVTVKGTPYEINVKEGLASGIYTRETYLEQPELTLTNPYGKEVNWGYTLDGTDPRNGSHTIWVTGKEFRINIQDILQEVETCNLRVYIEEDGIHTESQEFQAEYSVSYDNYQITVERIPKQTYTGAQIKPVIKAYDGDKQLVLNKDYTVSYKNNTDAGYADGKNPPVVVLKGKGAYSDTIEIPFTILPAHEVEISCKTFLPLKASGGNLTANLKDAKLTVKDTGNKKSLKEGKDYKVTYFLETGEGYKELSSAAVTCNKEAVVLLRTEGIGNYDFRQEERIVLGRQTDFSKAKVTFAQGKVLYGGDSLDSNLNPVTVKIGGKVIDPKYYEVSYVGNTEPGTVKVKVAARETVDGEANIYAGEVSASYTVVRAKLTEAVFENKGKIADREYAFGEPVTLTNGKEYTLKGRSVYNDGISMLTEGVDYEVSYEKNVNAGTATVIFTALDSGVYTGSVKKTFKITKPQLFVKNPATKAMELNEALNIRIESEDDLFRTVLTGDTGNMGSMGRMTYQEKETYPDIDITYKGVTLTEGVDYKLSYTNNKAVSTYDKNGNPAKYAAITITGMGNFTGTLKGSLKEAPGLTYFIEPMWITCYDANGADGDSGGADAVCEIPSVVYKKGNKTTYKPVPEIWSGYTEEKLQAGKDYTVTYLDNTNENIPVDKETGLPTEAVYRNVKIEFKGNYRGEAVCRYRITPLDFSKLFVTVDPQMYTWGKEELESEEIHVKVSKNSQEELTEGVDYIIEYSSGADFVGTGYVCLRGIGAYGGERQIKYTVGKAKFSWDNGCLDVRIIGDNIDGVSCGMYMDKKGAKPDVRVYFGTRILQEGKDFTLSFANNKTVSTKEKPATYTITGKGDFTGSITGHYDIVPYDFGQMSVDRDFETVIQPVVYNPSAKSYSVKISIKQNGAALKEGRDYRIVYRDNDNDASRLTEESVTSGARYIYFTVEGLGDYTGSDLFAANVLPVALSKMNVSFDGPLPYGVTEPENILRQAEITYKIGKRTYTLCDDMKELLSLENVSVNGLSGKAVLTGNRYHNDWGKKNITFKYSAKSVK